MAEKEYIGIETLSKKASITGTEKIPVSPTQYMETQQIVDDFGLAKHGYSDKDDEKTVEEVDKENTVVRYDGAAEEVDVSSYIETGYFINFSGVKVITPNSEYITAWLIPINKFDRLFISGIFTNAGYGLFYAFYEKDEVFISGFAPSENTNYSNYEIKDIPENAKFISIVIYILPTVPFIYKVQTAIIQSAGEMLQDTVGGDGFLQDKFDTKQDKLGFTPENAANKQNSLTADGTGEKYPTVDAVNEGLALKADTVDVMQNKQSIATLESILSDVNINQEAQVTTSGVDSVALPKTAANTGMKVQLFGTSDETANTIGTGRVRSDIGGRNLFTTHDKQDKVEVINGVKVLRSKDYPNHSGGIPSTVLVFSTNLEKNTDYTLSGEFTNTSPTGYNNIVLVYTNGKVNIGNFKKGYEKTVITFRLDSDREFVGLATDNGTDHIGYYKYDTIKLEKGTKATPWTPAPEDVLAGTAKGTGTSLYLTAPELRSNGLVKDEIRKGANGYELVKRVGVGTFGSELIPNGFDLVDTNSDGLANGFSISSPERSVPSIVSGNGFVRAQRLDYASGASGNTSIRIHSVLEPDSLYKFSFKYRSNFSFSITDSNYSFSGWSSIPINTGDASLIEGYIKTNRGYTNPRSFVFTSWMDTEGEWAEIGEITLKKIDTSYRPLDRYATMIGNNILYTIATPVITPIPNAGLLNSNSNGTVYFEPAVADAGVYDTKMDILLTDYPISAIESISKYEDGVFIPLNPATAIIAVDGLSFTHPDLASGDLVTFTYLYSLESTGRSMTLTHYDSRYVVKDTANTDVYKITPKITSGTLTWELTLV